MPTWLKVLLVIGATLLLIVCGLGYAGYHWYQTNGKAYVAVMKTARTDGRQFALTTDNAGCVSAALSQYGADTTIKEALFGGQVFLSSCLPLSKPTPGFCASVPSRKNRDSMVAWARNRCSAVSASSRYCETMLGAVEAFCNPRHDS